MTQISKINGIPLVDTKVTGFTYDNINTLTVSSNDGGSYSVSLTTLSASTLQASIISGTTFYGDGSNLSNVGSFSNFIISDGTNTETIDDGNTLLFVGGEAIKSTVSATDTVTFRLDITGTTAEPTPTSGDKLVIWDASSSTHKNIDWDDLPGSGGGEVNTASNVGVGQGIFSGKTGVDLQFYSLSGGSNTTLTLNNNTIVIDTTGGTSRTEATSQTTNATPITGDTIDSITDNATNIIEVFVKAYQSSATNWGVWKRTLTVTKVSGTVTIREENADVDKTSTGLNANSVDFEVSGGNINILLTGINATTIDWESAWEIIL